MEVITTVWPRLTDVGLSTKPSKRQRAKDTSLAESIKAMGLAPSMRRNTMPDISIGPMVALTGIRLLEYASNPADVVVLITQLAKAFV